MKNKLIRVTTIPLSLEKLLGGQLNFINQFYDVIAVSSNKKELEKYGKIEGVNTHHIELTRKITPFKDLKSTYLLYRFLKKEKPLIIHTHTPKAGIVGMLASYFAKVPYRLHTVAGMPLMEAKGFKRMILNIVEKITYNCATKVYPNSFELEKIIIKNKFVKSANKLKVIANGSSNGIDTTYFNPNLFNLEYQSKLRNDLGIEKEDFVFIFVGRIVADKGINELIKAFKKLSRENKKTKLLLVGSFEKDLDPLLKETINEIKVNTQIISLGYKNDVRPYFAIADSLVFPSYREGFPNVVMQAGAMNLPSIVSNINGCNEIIEENVNGFIIPVKNVDKLYVSMKRMMTNSDMKIKSRRMITTRFEQKVVWEALLNEYKYFNDNV